MKEEQSEYQRDKQHEDKLKEYYRRKEAEENVSIQALIRSFYERHVTPNKDRLT